MKILIVEDDNFKISKLERFMEDEFPQKYQLTTSSSVHAGHIALSEHQFDLLLLDMSLPTFSISGRESGGRPQVFGGKEILRFMKRKKINIPTLVITQFERFGKAPNEINIETLGREIEEEYGSILRGIIYFDPAEAWKTTLKSLLSKIIG